MTTITTKRCSSAFTLIELLIVVAIIGILAAIAVPNFLNARIRAQVAKTQGDMDATAKACLLFRVDQNKYPPMTDNIGETYVGKHVPPGDADEFTTFQANNAGQFIVHLTSPIAYINDVPIDPFSSNPTLTYGYAGGKVGFILTSFGPDRDQHEGINDRSHRGDIDEPSAYLLAEGESNEYTLISQLFGTQHRQKAPNRLMFYLHMRTYAPSNGLVSNGDLWRNQF